MKFKKGDRVVIKPGTGLPKAGHVFILDKSYHGPSWLLPDGWYEHPLAAYEDELDFAPEDDVVPDDGQ